MVKCETYKLNVLHSSPLLLLFIITILSLTNIAQAKDKRYPGELIDIGTHRLHINCVGEGTPSIIIDSGLGGSSLEWFNIQKNLAENTRICSYDRAGYGWSDVGPSPRTTARIAKELKTLLTKAKIPGPYLLVGHSFGGYNIRYFASEYPELTAGLVLIDSSHHEQFNTEEFKRVIRKPQSENIVNRKKSFRLQRIIPIIADNYPVETKKTAYMLMSRFKSTSTMVDESNNMEISAQQVAEKTDHQPYGFPVSIITRGKRVWPENELGNRREQQWARLQNDLKKISLQSDQHLAYESGHIIHLDQPSLVTENILVTLDKSRAQIHQNELIKKFDIRLANFSTIPSFGGPDNSFNYDSSEQDDYSILNKFVHQAMFHSKSRHFGNHSTYFLR